MAISGSISKEGDVVNFSYSGGVQSYTIPYDGLYKLEVYGAGGGTNTGGAGGYSIGYKVLKKNTILYICVGGGGNTYNSNMSTDSGAYNGGGTLVGQSGQGSNSHGGGGGATHIALINGTLEGIGYSSFITNGLIVAGGGGGGGYIAGTVYGGQGGGLTGGSGTTYDGDPAVGGGSQTGSGWSNFGAGYGSFGKGGTGTYMSSGGGGFYGGSGNRAGAGGGGSGWIDGVPSINYKGNIYSPSTSNGTGASARNSGSAKITFMVKGFPALKYNDTTLDGLTYNGTSIDTIIYNGTTLS